MKTSIIIIQLIFSIFISYLVFSTSIPDEGITKKMGKISGAYEALQFWNSVRAYPNDDIPTDAFFNAYKEMQEVRLNKTFKVGSNNHWLAIGPHNTGGRTNALASIHKIQIQFMLVQQAVVCGEAIQRELELMPGIMCQLVFLCSV